jgi:hypothetical protein
MRPPDLVQQLALGDQLAGIAHECLEQVPLRRSEAHLGSPHQDPAIGEVDAELLGLDDRLLGGGCRPP